MNHSTLDWSLLASEHQRGLPSSLGGAGLTGSEKYGANASLMFLRDNAVRSPVISERINLTSLLQGAGAHQSNVSSIAEYAALQQRLFLEEQTRRDLIAQALLSHQSHQNATTKPGMSELLAKLGAYTADQNLLSCSGKVVDGNASSPPLKKRRIHKTSAVAAEGTKAAPVMPLSYKEKKAMFPLPPKEGEGGKTIRILSLSKFESAWKHLESNGISDPASKRRFVSEFFSRKMAKHDEDRMYKKVHGLSNS